MPFPEPRLPVPAPTAHGALDPGELSRLGLDPAEVVDFSSNVNPYGPAPVVVSAVGEAVRSGDRSDGRSAVLAAYPDRECRALRAAFREEFGLHEERIAIGNGSAEVIDHLCRSYLCAGDTALVVGPTFGEYARASALCGAAILHFDRMVTPPDATLDLDGLISAVRRRRPRMVWLCSPNNPTGDLLARAAVERLLSVVAETSGLLVVDESYADLILEPAGPAGLSYLTGLLSHAGPGENLVLVRSMTKSHALAGLRLGYALAHPRVIEALRSVRPPWNVSGPAQAAGLATLTLAARKHGAANRSRLAGTKEYLCRELSRLGLEFLPGVANYLLVRVGDGAALRARLLRESLQLRDCASFGLPEYVRVAVLRPDDCERLVGALERALERPAGERL